MNGVIKTVPSYRPKCPNHGSTLEGCGFPLPAKGVGKCPVSGADFAFETDTSTEKMVQGKDGALIKSSGWKVSGDEEVTG